MKTRYCVRTSVMCDAPLKCVNTISLSSFIGVTKHTFTFDCTDLCMVSFLSECRPTPFSIHNEFSSPLSIQTYTHSPHKTIAKKNRNSSDDHFHFRFSFITAQCISTCQICMWIWLNASCLGNPNSIFIGLICCTLSAHSFRYELFFSVEHLK